MIDQAKPLSAMAGSRPNWREFRRVRLVGRWIVETTYAMFPSLRICVRCR